jgi:hypothetical protein
MELSDGVLSLDLGCVISAWDLGFGNFDDILMIGSGTCYFGFGT